jgi:hypothetical protein
MALWCGRPARRGESSGRQPKMGGMRRLRTRLVTSDPGGVGAPPGRPLRAARQELADDPGQCPDESAARRRKENAAVKRRKARRPASSAGGPSAEGPACSQDRPRGAAFRTSAFRRFTPLTFEGHRKGGSARHPPKNKASGRRSIGGRNDIRRERTSVSRTRVQHERGVRN